MQATSASLGIVLAALLLAKPSMAAPTTPEWYRNVDKAWDTTQASKRPLLVFITTQGCIYCKKMVSETFQDQGVNQDLAGAFVASVVDAKSNPLVVKHFGIRAFPTTLIVSPSGRLLDKINGFLPPQQFRQRLRRAYRHELSMRRGGRR